MRIIVCALAVMLASFGCSKTFMCHLNGTRPEHLHVRMTGRTASGTRRPLDRPTFARAWLRAALYEDAARRRLSVASW